MNTPLHTRRDDACDQCGVAFHLRTSMKRCPMRRDTLPQVFRCILCPVDFSANSRAALRYGALLARLSDAHLVVLYVEDPLLAAAMPTRPAARALVTSAEAELRRFVVNAFRGTTPQPSYSVLIQVGNPAREIVKTGARHACDLIVMGY